MELSNTKSNPCSSRSRCAARRHSRRRTLNPLPSPPSPVPWHVPNAELRVPVKVAMLREAAWLRMPPQVVSRRSEAARNHGRPGLRLRQTKDADPAIDVREPQEKAATIAKQKELYKKAEQGVGP